MRRIFGFVILVLLLSSCAVTRTLRPAPELEAPDLTAPVFDSISTRWQPFARSLAESGRMIPVSGNSIDIYTEGRSKFSNLTKDIREADSYIDMEYYRFSPDTIGHEVRDLLLDKAAGGVPVRLILETRTNAIRPSFYGALRRTEGVHTISVQPLRDVVGSLLNVDFRDHRKIAVIDGNICYTGGMNVADEYHTDWRDTHVRIEGPVVRDFERLFDNFWEYFRGDSVRTADPLPSPKAGDVIIQVAGDGPQTREKTVKKGFEEGLDAAQEYFYMQTPYLCPPPSTIKAMKKASLRGVDVRLMLPKSQDVPVMLWVNRFFYRRILKAGVRIFERGNPYMHSKTYVSDDYLSCYGSANIDNRSYNLNYESNLFVYDRGVALRSKDIFFEDLEHSEEIKLKDTRWNLLDRFLQGITILLGYSQW